MFLQRREHDKVMTLIHLLQVGIDFEAGLGTAQNIFSRLHLCDDKINSFYSEILQILYEM